LSIAGVIAHTCHSTPATRHFLLLLFRFGLFDLFHVFGRLFFEIFQAGLAAELDFARVVREHIRLAHLAEFIAGDDAGFQRVWRDLGIDTAFLSAARAATDPPTIAIARIDAVRFFIVLIVYLALTTSIIRQRMAKPSNYFLRSFGVKRLQLAP
jgi:hypothetical protein